MANSDATFTIEVSPDVAALIEDAVTVGGYASPSEAIRDALQGRKTGVDDKPGLSPADLRLLWDEGIASGPGRGLSLDEIEREVFRQGEPSTRG